MTLEKSNMKKMCSFCVSDWHTATTILPYVKEKTESDEKIISIFEKGFESNITELIKRMGIDKNIKNKITEIDWEAKNWNKYEQFEYFMEGNYAKDINLIVNGDTEYIKKINSYIDMWFSKNNFRIKKEEGNINVISCYDISDGFLQESVLPKYDYILNTSGEKRINEFFKNDNKIKIAN